MPTPETHPHSPEPQTQQKPKVGLKEACQHLISACDAMQDRLGHAYGCPAASSGDCTCGSKALHEALHELHDAVGA